jgi:CrcB protein
VKALEPFSLVGLGSAAGGACRVAFGLWLHQVFAGAVFFSALGVNLLGSLLIGVLAARMGVLHGCRVVPRRWLFWGPGFCGGFTTFSFFSWESLLLWQTGERGAVVLLVAATILGSVFLVWAGVKLGGGK